MSTEIAALLEGWETTGNFPASSHLAIDAESNLCEAVKSSLLAIDGVDAVVYKNGSAGSIYFECFSDASDTETISITVRVSNHKAGKRGCENAADIVVGDSEAEIERQLAKAADAMAAAIAFACN